MLESHHDRVEVVSSYFLEMVHWDSIGLLFLVSYVTSMLMHSEVENGFKHKALFPISGNLAVTIR